MSFESPHEIDDLDLHISSMCSSINYVGVLENLHGDSIMYEIFVRTSNLWSQDVVKKFTETAKTIVIES
jgi:hypothetical protein